MRGWRGRMMAGALVVLGLLGGLARAQEAGLSAHDTSLPIEITADRLTVEQGNRVAVFSGSVEAVQGELALKADRLKVHYALEQGQADTGQAVRRIEAEGHVLFTSPRESARAERADYDVASGRMRLDGHVVLTRNGNVIRGDRLDIDLRTRKAVMVASSGGRVHGVFVPKGGEARKKAAGSGR